MNRKLITSAKEKTHTHHYAETASSTSFSNDRDLVGTAADRVASACFIIIYTCVWLVRLSTYMCVCLNVDHDEDRRTLLLYTACVCAKCRRTTTHVSICVSVCENVRGRRRLVTLAVFRYKRLCNRLETGSNTRTHTTIALRRLCKYRIYAS